MQPLLVDLVQFKIFAAISALLILKMVLLAFSVGTVRTLRRRWSSPEDAKFIGGSTEADPLVERLRRAHLNAIENELPFIGIGLLFVLVGAPVLGIQAYGYTFLVARVVHSVTYVASLQPFRTLSFGLGALCLLGMSTQVLMAAFGG
jgi:uncharacterized MAPEG superfamily protein